MSHQRRPIGCGVDAFAATVRGMHAVRPAVCRNRWSVSSVRSCLTSVDRRSAATAEAWRAYRALSGMKAVHRRSPTLRILDVELGVKSQDRQTAAFIRTTIVNRLVYDG
jgi:hypothetical protein